MNLFDLENEKRIISSGVRDVFTPYKPIMTKELFYGRSSEVSAIIKQMNTPGQHSILFGERGVGKSSLANIAAEYLKPLKGNNLIKKRCDSGDTFITIVEKLLEAADVDLQVTSIQKQKAEGGKAGVKIPVFEAGVESKNTDTINLKGFEERAGSPSWVTEKIKDINGLFLLDEIDVINEIEKWKVAELVKQLSDEGSSLKFLIVGIAETASQLTNGHKSVQRCLKETPLLKLDDDEIIKIVEDGAKKVGLKFSKAAVKKIANISSGYAHFAHLIALKAAEKAIGEQREDIALGHINDATNDACGDAEGVLRTTYNNATRSSHTDEFKKILIAAASIVDSEFKSAELRSAYEKVWGAEVKQGWVNNYLQNIVSEGSDTILRRLAKGVYKFNDPRMPSYIKLANLTIIPDIEQENAVD